MYVQNGRYSDYTIVLIDTWWNVNCMHTKGFIKILPVLIDTWWNVNCF